MLLKCGQIGDLCGTFRSFIRAKINSVRQHIHLYSSETLIAAGQR